MEIIKNENLNLSVSDVGGNLGRKIHFYTDTGRVLLKRINRIPEVVGDEQDQGPHRR